MLGLFGRSLAQVVQEARPEVTLNPLPDLVAPQPVVAAEPVAKSA